MERNLIWQSSNGSVVYAPDQHPAEQLLFGGKDGDGASASADFAGTMCAGIFPALKANAKRVGWCRGIGYPIAVFDSKTDTVTVHVPSRTEEEDAWQSVSYPRDEFLSLARRLAETFRYSDRTVVAFPHTHRRPP